MAKRARVGFAVVSLCVGLAQLSGCASARKPLPTARTPLSLEHVVLYRNGIGYFERRGTIQGDTLSLRVRKDQVNDLLKSLTVIDRSSGKALSVSMPLDPKAWQDAALSLLMPGRGRLSEVLDTLRGTRVSVTTSDRSVRGRIVLVEPLTAPPVIASSREIVPPQPGAAPDHKLTLLDGSALEIVKLSEIETITLEEGDLVMQLDRHLDASAGEGMFQQVDVVVRMSTAGKHDLSVSYVAEAPLWKPTYRLVLADDGSGQALLQAWAVVANVSGENWDDVALGLTSGAPLAFRYDLHTPEDVERPDLTRSSANKHASVAFGETSYGADEAQAQEREESAPAAGRPDYDYADDMVQGEAAASPKASEMKRSAGAARRQSAVPPMAAPMPAAPPPPSVDMRALAQSAATAATSRQVAGLTRFDLSERVTLPDGSASMVMLINELVPGEETFLFRPGGSGQGYENNPYRVVRFHNETDFVLEPGPIGIYAGGSFVGEGLSEAIASRDTATIPFAAEPSILVHSQQEHVGDELRLTKIVRGVMEVASFRRIATVWSVQGKPSARGYRVLLRHPRAGSDFALVEPPKDTETLADAYLIPIAVAPGQTKGSVRVVEQSPSRVTLTIWDDRVPELLKQVLEQPSLDANVRAALQPVVDLRQAIGRLDTEIEGLQTQQRELDERANEERQNLLAIQKDPRAAVLRARVNTRLDELTREAQTLGRRIVDLGSQRLERKIELEDKLRTLDLTAPPSSEQPIRVM
jgi:hypothetical protein